MKTRTTNKSTSRKRMSVMEQAKAKGVAAGTRTARILKSDPASLMRWGAEQIQAALEAAKAGDLVKAAYHGAAGLEAQIRA